MRKITVSRPEKMKLPFSKGKILIDGNECGVVKAGKTESLDIPDNSRDIQVIFAAVPPVSSNVLSIGSADTAFEVRIKVPLKNTEETYAELTKK